MSMNMKNNCLIYILSKLTLAAKFFLKKGRAKISNEGNVLNVSFNTQNI